MSTETAAPTAFSFADIRVSSVKQSFDRQVAAIDAYRDQQGNPILAK